MTSLLKPVKKGLVTLLAASCFYSCTAPEDRVKGKELSTAAKVYTVVIQQMKFTPADLTVSEGDTVTWINRDIVEHM